jgi:hypothetical protein
MERQTRPHQHVNVAIVRGDQQKLYGSLSRWELYYAAPDHRLLPLSPNQRLRACLFGGLLGEVVRLLVEAKINLEVDSVP